MNKPFPITVIRRYLSDGSPVYDVRIGGIDLPAVSERDADALAEKVKDAIEDHTNARVRISDVV